MTGAAARVMLRGARPGPFVGGRERHAVALYRYSPREIAARRDADAAPLAAARGLAFLATSLA